MLLLTRKRRLRRIMPYIESRLRFMDHIEGRGVDLFGAACERDLEGIVGKWPRGSYSSDGRSTSWVKIKNPSYSQMEGRHELFKQPRTTAPRRTARAALTLSLA